MWGLCHITHPHNEGEVCLNCRECDALVQNHVFDLMMLDKNRLCTSEERAPGKLNPKISAEQKGFLFHGSKKLY